MPIANLTTKDVNNYLLFESQNCEVLNLQKNLKTSFTLDSKIKSN